MVRPPTQSTQQGFVEATRVGAYGCEERLVKSESRAVGALFFTARSLNEMTMFDHVMLGRGMTIMDYPKMGNWIWKLSKFVPVIKILYIKIPCGFVVWSIHKFIRLFCWWSFFFYPDPYWSKRQDFLQFDRAVPEGCRSLGRSVYFWVGY